MSPPERLAGFHFQNHGDVFSFQRRMEPSQRRRAVKKCSTVRPNHRRPSIKRNRPGRAQKQTSRSKVRVGIRTARGQLAPFLRSCGHLVSPAGHGSAWQAVVREEGGGRNARARFCATSPSRLEAVAAGGRGDSCPCLCPGS